MKNPITATNDGSCKLDNPEMAWPDVQPPAYRVPNPIRNPPTTKSKNPFKLVKVLHENKDSGTSAFEEPTTKPRSDRSLMVAVLNWTGSGLANSDWLNTPPRIEPITNRSNQS